VAGVVDRQQEKGLGQVLSAGEPSPGRAIDEQDAHLAGSGFRGGPYLLVFPLLVAVATVWWIRRPEGRFEPSRPPERVDLEATQEVLGGELDLGGAQLVFWLAPWEPDAERQAFQAQALRARYGLSEGEPWRLRLEWRGGADSAQRLDVASIAIEDTAGPALAPLRLSSDLDPLATLLAPPAQALSPGRALDLCLWGRTPGEGPQGPSGAGCPGAAGSCPLPCMARRG
jgi:hypothetical protein